MRHSFGPMSELQLHDHRFGPCEARCETYGSMLWLGALRCKHFGETVQHHSLGATGNPAKFPDKTGLVNRTDLVQHDLTMDALKCARDPRGVVSSLGCHWRNDDGRNVVVHLVWRDDQAWTGLLNLMPARWVQRDKKDIKSSHFHSHSFSSHAGPASATRSTSTSSPRAAMA